MTYSPRARVFLFTLSRPKGLRVDPIVEKCAEFRNPFLKKIPMELFSQIEIKQGYPPPGYPLFKISHTNLTPLSYVSVNFSAKRQLKLFIFCVQTCSVGL